MSSGSWQDVSDSIYIEGEEPMNNKSPSLLLTKESNHPVLNFDKFNNLNIDYQSDKSFQEENNHNHSQPELPYLSNSTISFHENDKLSTSSSTQSNSTEHNSSNQFIIEENHALQQEQMDEYNDINDIKQQIEEEVEEIQQQEQIKNELQPINNNTNKNHTMPNTMSNTIIQNHSVYKLSHADSFASWSPLKKGASIPWLFTNDKDINQSSDDDDENDDDDDDVFILQKKWNALQQAKLQKQKIISDNNNNNNHLSPLKTPSSPPINSITDFDTDTSYIQSFQPISNMNHHHHDNRIFHFSPIISDHYQANESLLLHIKDLTHQNVYHTIKDLDLSHQQLTAIYNLNTLLPQLENLNISFNKITNLSGLPSTIKSLRAKSNKLTDIQGFKLLYRLEYLDISDNALDTFDGIGTLYYLKTLLADNNKLTGCSALNQMHGLVTLSLHGNSIEDLDFEDASMFHLQKFDLSYNRIRSIENLKGLPRLQELNICYNNVEFINLIEPLNNLSILKISHNRLKSFDGRFFPNLKLLYIDKNQLVSVVRLSSISNLDTLSLRDQGEQSLQIEMKEINEIRKLYISGMPIKQLNSLAEFNHLEYLELCSTQLEELPTNFASQVPNLGALYLSYNYIKDISPLKDLKLLQKLVLIDNRIKHLNDLISTIHTLPSLVYLDLRQNPLTYKLYANVYCPTVYKSTNHHHRSPLSRYVAHEHDTSWISRDALTFDNLPEHWKQRRIIYRSLFITECRSLEILDNITITTDERNNALINVEDYIKNE
ncbi:unnamed protein product [Cunninghamella blakesleeana]